MLSSFSGEVRRCVDEELGLWVGRKNNVRLREDETENETKNTLEAYLIKMSQRRYWLRRLGVIDHEHGGSSGIINHFKLICNFSYFLLRVVQRAHVSAPHARATFA